MGRWYSGHVWPRAGDVFLAADGTSFVVKRATTSRSYVYGLDTLPQSTFPPPDVEELHGGLEKVLRDGAVIWSAHP